MLDYIFECNYVCSVDNEFEKILIFDWNIYASCFTLMSRFYIYIEREYREIDKDGNLLHVRIVDRAVRSDRSRDAR